MNQNKNVKIFRIGHRQPRSMGVITIASEVYPETGEIFFGSSFCHPKERRYDKKFGIAQALKRLDLSKEQDNSLKLEGDIAHSKVLNAILVDMFYDMNRPAWTEELILEQLDYPSGLKRFNNNDTCSYGENFGISKIIVNSEYAKEQLSLALEYINGLNILDENFISIKLLLEMAYYPDLIEVKK